LGQAQQTPHKRTSTRLAMKRSAKTRELEEQQQQVAAAAALEKQQQQQQQQQSQLAQHAQQQWPARLPRDGGVSSWDPAIVSHETDHNQCALASPQASKKQAVVIDPAAVQDPPQLIPQRPQHHAPSTAIASGLHQTCNFPAEIQPVRTPRQRGGLECGLWGLLPEEVSFDRACTCPAHSQSGCKAPC